MPPARTSRRSGLAASASSSSIASPSTRSQRQDGPRTPGSATRSAGPSTSRATPRSTGSLAPASSAQSRHGAERDSVQITPTKSPASNSYNDPIIIEDSDDEGHPVGSTHPGLHSKHRHSQPLSSLSPSSIGNPDESTSTTTIDQSYATSLTSDLNMVSDGTLTSVSSDESDSDVPEKSAQRGVPFASPPRRLTRTVRSARAVNTATPVSSNGREAPSQTPSETPTPSRRSARIVSSGSSVKKALQRRDELDAKLLASPVRTKPDASDPPSSLPTKRQRGRPRRSATDDSLVQTQASPAAVQPSPKPPAHNSSPATSRRSSRLSLPTAAEPKEVQAKAAKKAGSESQEPEAQPKRGRRSQGAAVPAESPPASVDDSQVAEVPPAKRGPGRPRKIAPNEVPIVSSASSSPAKVPTRSSKRSFSDLAKAADAAPGVAQEPDNERSPRRKRGRPRKETLDESMDEDYAASPADVRSRSVQAEADAIARQQAIDMLDENVSELSDASEESLDSSAPSQTAALPRRRGRPPKDRSLDGDSVKRVSRPEKGGKKFHVSGLYAGEAEATPSISSTKPTEAQNVVFPNPIHFGAQLLVEERDFCLPYPIHQTMDQLREKVHAKRKPPRYQQISKNKYYSRPKLQGEVPLCNCKPGSGCGSDCINRMLQFICDPRTCPNGNSCTNVSLGRRTGIKTAVAYYGRRGFGLKTLEAIKQHDFIDEYRGEVINLSEAAKRVTEEYKATGNYYLLDYDSAAGELLDGGRKGNITRFANHSCDPNCRIEKFIICGTDEARSAEFQIGLFANRDIEAGEELTYNYGWAAFQPRDTMTGAPTAQVPTEQCLCGAANCSGILGGKKAPATKVIASDVASGSRKKGAKGKGKGKGKSRKTAQTKARPRLRAMTPMMSATRLSSATMPASARLSAAGSRSSRKREETQANLVTKIVIKRRERSARMAADAAASNGEPSAAGAAMPEGTIAKRGVEVAVPTPNTAGPSSQASIPTTAKPRPAVRLPLATLDTAALAMPQNTPATVQAEGSTPQASSAKHAVSAQGRPASASGSAAPAALSKASDKNASQPNPRMLLAQSLASSRLGNKFGRAATVTRGTKDRRWSAAQAMVSDDDDDAWDVSDSEGRASDFQRQDVAAQPTPALDKTVAGPRRRGRRKLVLTAEEAERRAVDRRARNAFLARVRRASKRGIVIEDPTQHPLKKISIQCTAAPENTYIPDLPSSLVTLGMSTADARRARNAFLARVRRAVKRGFPKDLAIKMAAKPLPGDGSRDTPVMQAQRAYLEQLEREAVSEMEADASRAGSSRQAAPQSAATPSATANDDGWVDTSNWTAAQ